jgi:vitamin B12 transporter
MAKIDPTEIRVMTTSVHRACLAALPLALAAAFPSSSFAQGQTLPETVVTANRVATRADELLAEVKVIDRAEIEASTARTLPELLARMAGVQMFANGGRGKNSSVFIRGNENRHTILLVDGVRLGSATTGTPSWENIPVEMIERIEVLKGPASALYGSDGVGGVVQIFTRQGVEGFHPYAQATAGSYRHWSAGGGVSGGQGALTYSFGVQRLRERGFNATRPVAGPSTYNGDVDPFWQDAVNGSLRYAFNKDWSADAGLLYTDGISWIDDGLGFDSRSAVRALTAHVGVKGRILPAWQSELLLSQGNDTSNSIVARLPGKFKTEQAQWAWQNDVITPVGVVLAGLEQREQKVSATTAYAVTSRTIDSAFAGLNGSQGSHNWQVNLRRDSNSQFGDVNTWFAGYGLRITDAWRVHASRGTSFVAPSFNQLYFPGFGNPLLRSERGRNTDLGVTWSAGGHEVKLVRFDNRVRDLIVNVSTPAGLLRPENVQRARIDGWTLGYAGRLGATTVRADMELLEPRNLDTGRQLQRRARRQLTLGADHAVGAWRFGGSLLAVGDRYDDTANRRRLGGYTTLDVYADWQLDKDWNLQAKINNLTDKQYETAFGYNQPGRAFYLTLRWQPK